jgi:hypothetical protein
LVLKHMNCREELKLSEIDPSGLLATALATSARSPRLADKAAAFMATGERQLIAGVLLARDRSAPFAGYGQNFGVGATDFIIGARSADLRSAPGDDRASALQRRRALCAGCDSGRIR